MGLVGLPGAAGAAHPHGDLCASQQESERSQKRQRDARNPSPSQLASPGGAGKERLWPLADADGAWLEVWSPWGAKAVLAAGGGDGGVNLPLALEKHWGFLQKP